MAAGHYVAIAGPPRSCAVCAESFTSQLVAGSKRSAAFTTCPRCIKKKKAAKKLKKRNA